MSDDAPLILTLRFDDAHQARFDALRAAHFPPKRNYLRAHVTLFHALPGEMLADVTAALAEASAATPAPTVEVQAPYTLGRGVAYRMRSDAVVALRKQLAGRWSGLLTPQDRSFSGLHVTVQNKVEPAAARALLAELAAGFAPDAFVSPGLDLWRYRGGPWDHEAGFDFAAVSPPPCAEGSGRVEPVS